jgi:thioredoxin-related protein
MVFDSTTSSTSSPGSTSSPSYGKKRKKERKRDIAVVDHKVECVKKMMLLLVRAKKHRSSYHERLPKKISPEDRIYVESFAQMLRMFQLSISNMNQVALPCHVYYRMGTEYVEFTGFQEWYQSRVTI